MAIEYDRTAPVLDNTSVDNIKEQLGQIDTLANLSFDMPDADIIRNLNHRINDSESYWNDSKGFDLKNARAVNERQHLGRVDEPGLYKHQRGYKENQVFAGEESIVAYVTSQIAGPRVIPAGSEDIHKLFASDLEKAIQCWSEEVVSIESIVELSTRNILNKRVAITKFYFDKNYGAKGEIIAEALDPNDVILDKNAALGANPEFICHTLKRSVERLISEFPKKEKDILDKAGIQRKTPKQMTKEYAVREVWVTWYDKSNNPTEGVVWYFNDMVLEKIKNPNYLYAKPEYNLIPFPKKPFIFGNLVNYGKHLIDSTTPLEQAIPLQDYLARRGRQIAENADKANGILVVSTKSGLTKDDGQNMVGDPNQKLFVADEDGQGVTNLVTQLQAQVLPDYVMEDKRDARMQIGNIMGAPIDFTGAEANDGDPTLGQTIIKKNAASGRQDMMVRAITRMLSQIYEYFVQMAIVWYTEDHQFTYDAGDGDFDFVTLKRDLIHKGIRVKASKPANPDRSRIEGIAIKLIEGDKISLLDAYKILQLDNAQQLYDNWAKQQSDPMALARDALDVVDESEAYVAFKRIMDGEDVEEKQNPSKEYVLSLRKLMINDDFLKAKKSLQNKFIKYVNKCIDSLEYRLSLDEASDVSPDANQLRPGAPLPDPAQQQPGAGMPMPPAGPNGMPPMPPANPGPMMGGPMGPPPQAPLPSSIFSGTPIPAPGQSVTPNGPIGLPMV